MENAAPPQDFVLDGSMLGYGWRPTQGVLAKRLPKAAFTPGLKSHEKTLEFDGLAQRFKGSEGVFLASTVDQDDSRGHQQKCHSQGQGQRFAIQDIAQKNRKERG